MKKVVSKEGAKRAKKNVLACPHCEKLREEFGKLVAESSALRAELDELRVKAAWAWEEEREATLRWLREDVDEPSIASCIAAGVHRQKRGGQ